MKALQITEAGHTRTAEVEMPRPREGEVLLRIQYVGFCGSDLNTFRGLNPMVRMPVIPGHEVGAVVEAVGSGVPSVVTPGQNVTVNPYTNCGRCAACRNGRPNACEHNETLGVQRNGAMQQFLAVPWQKVIPAPGLSLQQCALVEPMSVGFHAVARAAVTDTDTVAVIGCGMIGLGAIVRASMRGARVIALDLDDDKLALARMLGASETINTLAEPVADRVRELTGGLMADVVVEAVGSPATYVIAVDIVGFTGRVTCIGYAKHEVSFQTKLFVQKELDIRGSRNALPQDFRAVIHYLQQSSCPVERLISAVVTPDGAQLALEQWAAHPGRVFRILVQFNTPEAS